MSTHIANFTSSYIAFYQKKGVQNRNTYAASVNADSDPVEALRYKTGRVATCTRVEIAFKHVDIIRPSQGPLSEAFRYKRPDVGGTEARSRRVPARTSPLTRPPGRSRIEVTSNHHQLTKKFQQFRKKHFSRHNVAGYACQVVFSPDGKWSGLCVRREVIQ
ncbi:hypothetical protein PENSPDRAFT_663075 [Peniophora sp. CONT]|nr:hypothetical protein PENSPDRAFT_663075 [Peniophora sp. CONT]